MPWYSSRSCISLGMLSLSVPGSPHLKASPHMEFTSGQPRESRGHIPRHGDGEAWGNLRYLVKISPLDFHVDPSCLRGQPILDRSFHVKVTP